MNQSEISDALRNCGLGEMTAPTAEVRQFEAYGDGALNVAEVHLQGVLKLFDGDGELLWLGFPGDEEDVLKVVSEHGHYADC